MHASRWLQVRAEQLRESISHCKNRTTKSFVNVLNDICSAGIFSLSRAYSRSNMIASPYASWVWMLNLRSVVRYSPKNRVTSFGKFMTLVPFINNEIAIALVHFGDNVRKQIGGEMNVIFSSHA